MMLPINVIQTLIKSGAIQQLHSLSNVNSGEQKPQNPTPKILNLMQAIKNDTTENSLQHGSLQKTDTVELTTSESSQFLQQQITIQTKEYENIYLRMSGRKKNDKLDPDFCRLLFSLVLKNLDEVVIDVKVQNRIISLTIFSHAQGIESLVGELRSSLQKNLESIGYQLSSVKIGNVGVSAGDEKVEKSLANLQERVDCKI
ncbi:hypothetical protein [Bacillus sinesaloumensis]|uniref:hypothetical protein n=1 Tax=Litchfieldia sinesaloumensis TaxID=1926280 RepID=UPI00114E473C|nr:hypothetical protein [Bacillus sinesaloumensis]